MSDENRHVAFICSKGTLDMAYPALIMGWAALGNGIDVTIFFTFWGMDLINKSRVDHLEIAPVGNTSSVAPTASAMREGYSSPKALPCSTHMAAISAASTAPSLYCGAPRNSFSSVLPLLPRRAATASTPPG